MVKIDDSTQMVVVFTVKEIRYVVLGFFDDLMDLFLYSYL